MFPEVTNLFVTPYAGQADDDRFGVALGFPTRTGDRKFVTWDYTETNEMAGDTQRDVYCVAVYEFRCGRSRNLFDTLSLHFLRCKEAALHVGADLCVDPSHHPELEEWVLEASAPS